MLIGNNFLKLLFISTAVFFLALLYYFFDARNASSFFPHCPFNTLTGLYCPGCGSQRAVSALLHGDIRGAFGYNALAMLASPFLLYAAGVFVYNSIFQKKIQQKIFYSKTFVIAVLCSVIAFWILRNIVVYPFTLLAPHT